MIRLLILMLAAVMGFSPPAAAAKISDVKGVRAAFLFGFPVYQMAFTRSRAIAIAQADSRTVINRFGHRSRLTRPSDRIVTTPNNDTLYSAAWLDLASGPVVLTIPPLPDRYHSVALLSLFTDNFAVLGTRSHGGKGGRFLVVSPAWRGAAPRGLRLIRAPTNDVWAISRVLVDGPEDLAAAVEAQTRMTVQPLRSARREPVSGPSPEAVPTNPAEFLAIVNQMLGRGPLPAERKRRAATLKRFGISPGDPGAFATLSPAVQEQWRLAMPVLRAELARGFQSVGEVRQGWSYPRRGMGTFGSDDFYRAAVALGGLAALPSEEAVYLTAEVDSSGADLHGSHEYTLRIPADVPIRQGGFWSLTMYELTPDGRLFFTENALRRYAIGDRTPDLVRNSDGSIDVLIQNKPPPSAHSANWLPSPPGAFRLNFRAYLPRPEMRDQRWRMPAIARAGPHSTEGAVR